MANASVGNAYIPGGAGGGGVGIAAGGVTQTSGTVVFSNSNGVTFGYNNGTITATVTPGAAAGIAAIQLPNTTYTSGTAIFSNANGFSFGSSAGGGITGSYTVPSATIFSNSNNVSFGLAGSTITASASQPAASSLSFSNANGVTFGTAGSTLTASYNSTSAVGQGTTFAGTNVSASMTLNTAGVNLALSAAAGGGAAISAAGNSINAGTVVFSNSNGITFGMAGSTITATVNPGAAAGIAAIQVSNTTYTSGTAIFSNANGFSFGSSAGGAITGSYTVPVQTQFVLSASNGLAFGTNGSTVTGSYSQSAQAFSASGGSSTFSTLNFANSNGLTFSNSAGSVVASYNNTSAAGLGTTFAGTNISASITLNTAGLNLALSGAAGGGPNISAGTTSGNLGSIVFSNSNGVSFGLNGSTITASASGAGASATVLALGNTTAQSSSNSFALSAFNVSGSGIVSVGMSGNTLVISAPGTTNFANLSVSAGTTSGSLGSLVFSNSNGVSFGLNGSTITASAAGGGGGGVNAGVSTFGNTAGSTGTVSTGNVVFVGSGPISLSQSTGAAGSAATISILGPATSSLSATGAVSISTNGSTISIGVPSAVTFSNAYFPYKGFDLAAGIVGQGSLLFDPVDLPNLTFDRLLIPIYNTNSAVSSGSHSLSFYAGIYSRNASTLSLVGSASGSTAVTHSGQAGSYSLYSGVRHFSIASANSLSQGQYWMAFGSRSSSAGADGSYYNMQLNNGSFTDALLSGNASYGAIFGSSVNATNQFQLGQGYYTATSTGMPASVAFSQINGTASQAANMQAIIFGNSTI